MPSANGLGINCETYRSPRTSTSTSALPAPAAGARSVPTFSVPKGLLVNVIYSSFFFIFPVLTEYVTYDYDTTLVQAGVIISATLAALFLIFANNPWRGTTWSSSSTSGWR